MKIRSIISIIGIGICIALAFERCPRSKVGDRRKDADSERLGQINAENGTRHAPDAIHGGSVAVAGYGVIGRVVDDDGQPVSGAQVTLFNRSGSVVSDDDGLFEITGVPRDTYAAIARKGALVGVGSNDLEDVDSPLVIRMTQGAKLTINVRDAETDLPLREARIAMWGSVAKAGTDGVVILEGVVPGSAYIMVSASEYESQEREVNAGSGSHLTKTIALYRGVRVNGLVIDSNGEPRGGVTVDIGNKSTGDLVDRVATADDGSWEVQALAPGPHRFTVRNLGFVLARESITIRDGGAQSIVLRIPQGFRVHGTVFDYQARPIPTAVLHSPGREVGVDQQGRFTLSDLPMDGALVWAKNGHMASEIIEVSAADAKAISLVVHETRVSGRVFFSATKDSDSSVIITLESIEGAGRFKATASENGEFEIAGVPLSRYRIHAAYRVNGLLKVIRDTVVLRAGAAKVSVNLTDANASPVDL